MHMYIIWKVMRSVFGSCLIYSMSNTKPICLAWCGLICTKMGRFRIKCRYFRTCPRFTCSKKGDGIDNCLSGQRNCQAAARPRATLSTFHVADKRCKEKEQCASSQQQCWEQGRGELESAVSSGEPQEIIMSIHADLKMKIPHICSVYVGFAVPPTQSLVPTHVSVFQGQSCFWDKLRASFLACEWSSVTDLFAFPPSPSVPKWFPTQATSRDDICKARPHCISTVLHLAPLCWAQLPQDTAPAAVHWLGRCLSCSLTPNQDEGCLGIISLGNLGLVTSVCTSQYSGEWDGTDGSAASWHIISHLPQPLALKWGPGYGPTEGRSWQQW